MGTSAPPAAGYADDQRLENWDSPLLFSDQQLVGAGIQTPALDVSRYAYIGGLDYFNGPGDGITEIFWSRSQTMNPTCGHRIFYLSPNIPLAVQFRIVNLGSWCSFLWHGLGGANPQHVSQIFATNRVYPLEFIPQNTLLARKDSGAIGFGGTDYTYPSDYYAGPIHVWLNVPDTKSWLWSIQNLNSSGLWQVIDQDFTPVANHIRLSLVAPAGAWRFAMLNNTGISDNYSLAITHPQTGSL